MSLAFYKRNLFELTGLAKQDLLFLLDLALRLKQLKHIHKEPRLLTGKNIALVFAKPSTRTRCAFEVAAFDQGAAVTYIDSSSSHLAVKESLEDTFAVLGRFYHAIAYRGYRHADLLRISPYADQPIWNALSDIYHPTQALADVLTMREHCQKPWHEIHCCYLGNALNNVTHSLMVTAAILGMKITIAAPSSLQPAPEVRTTVENLMQQSGGRLLYTEDTVTAVQDADFVYTDVWLSMGEPEDAWQERIDLLTSYRVTRQLLAHTGNPATKFMHCLPALHNRACQLGDKIFAHFGQNCLEVTDDVFTSEASVVFDQAENRLHTIKALMLATLHKDLAAVY